jgi:hypothetical protein
MYKYLSHGKTLAQQLNLRINSCQYASCISISKKFNKKLTETTDDSSCNAHIVRVAVIPDQRQYPDSLSKHPIRSPDSVINYLAIKLTFRRGATSRGRDTTTFKINQLVKRSENTDRNLTSRWSDNHKLYFGDFEI